MKTFENCIPDFLDIQICPNGLGISHKHSQTGQYVHIHSYTLSRYQSINQSINQIHIFWIANLQMFYVYK